MLVNLRIKLGCYIVSKAIKLMPDEWQTEKAVKNLIAIKKIKTI